MITAITFDTAIGTDYKRNNRSTRQKSLRCFPSCGIKGHVTGGFCGLPLKVTLDIRREDNITEFYPKDYKFIAEIRSISQPKISNMKEISEANLKSQFRFKYEKNEANGEVFESDNATVVSSSSSSAGKGTEVELTFNSQHCSWDYSWKSNRWSGPQEQHVVDIIVLKRIPGCDDYRVVSSASSTPFVVCSSHKKPAKTNQIKEEDDDEPICLPAARGRKNSRSTIYVDEVESRMSTMNTSTLTSHPNPDSRGVAPRGYLTESVDGKNVNFVPYRSEESSIERSPASRSNAERTGDQKGDFGMIALCDAAGAVDPAPVVAVAVQTFTKRDKKSVSASGEGPGKRMKVEGRTEPHHQSYFPPYTHFPIPAYPPHDGYIYHALPYPPHFEGKDGKVDASRPQYPPHAYPPSYPPPGYYPPYAYSQVPPPHLMPPPYAMPPPHYPVGPPPPGSSGYPVYMYYSQPMYAGYRPAPAARDSTGSSDENESDAEEEPTGVTRPSHCGNTSVSARNDEDGAVSKISALPVAVPVPLGTVERPPSAASEGDQKVLKVTKRIRVQKSSSAGSKSGSGVCSPTWDGCIAEAPAGNYITPLGPGSTSASSATNPSAPVSHHVQRVTNGSITA